MRNATFRHPLLALLLAVALALLTSACGSDDTTGTTDETAEAAAETDGDMSMDEHTEAESEHTFAFGEPADASEADRTVQVQALDELAFDPETIEVAAGEVITFEVTNNGVTQHEFTLGDEHAQEEHETEMAEMAEEGMAMHDEPNAITVAAGETKTLTWHFTETGEVLFGCHEPGHYGAGMVGTITVT